MDLVVAADPGKRADPTAICVTERIRPRVDGLPTDKWPTSWNLPRSETSFLVRELGRLSIGTSHVDGAYEIAKVCHDLRCYDPEGSLQFFLDVTGIGEAIADLMESYLPSDVRLTRCWFTSSERVERTRGELRVGKAHMVSRLTSLLETGRVRLGDIPQREALVEELRDFEFKVTAAGNYHAEARSGAHDDLITTLGLATLTDGGAQAPRYRHRDFCEPSPMPVDGDPWEALHTSPW